MTTNTRLRTAADLEAAGEQDSASAAHLAQQHQIEAEGLIALAEMEGRSLRASEARAVEAHTREVAALGALANRADARELAARAFEARELAERRAAAEPFVAAFSPRPSTLSGDERADMASFLRGDGRRSIDLSAPRGFSFAELARRDLTKGAATAGGHTVPTSFYAQLQAHLIQTAALAQAATIITTSSGESLQVPKTTAHSTAGIVAEAGAIPESDPAFGQVTLGSFKYAFACQASTELVADSGVDLASYLAQQAGRALGNAAGGHFVTGTGTGQPRGLVTAAATGVTGAAASAGAFTADNLIDLFHSVIPQYRASTSCAWLMSDSAWAAVRKLKDTQNRYLIGDLAAGAEPMLLGKSVLIDPNVAAPAALAKSVAFGDLGAYMIRMAGPIRIERSDDFAFLSDLITWRFVLRADGNLIDETGAVKLFAGGAA